MTTTKFEPPTLPCELYAQAVERAETALTALKSRPAPIFPAAALRATEAIARAAKELHYATLCLDNAESIQREANNE